MSVASRLHCALLVSAFVLAGCGTDASAGVDSLDGAWELRAGTVDGSPLTVLPDHRVTATIAGDQLQGRAACNQYGALIEVSGGSITFAEMAWTSMGCEPQVMEAEQAYMDALARVSNADRFDSALLLSGPGVELEFALLGEVPTADLVGVTWMLSEIVQGDETASPAEGADDPADPAMLVLHPDGSVSGSTGCRDLTGEYVISGDEVVFTSFAAGGDCLPELQLQDNQVISVLEGGFTVTIDGRRLTVTAPGGEALVFRAGP